MKSLCTMALIAVAGFGLATAAIAQDTTTTTTTTTSPGPSGPGVFVGVPGVAGVQVGAPPGPGGCTTRSTTQTDGAGDSRSVTSTNC